MKCPLVLFKLISDNHTVKLQQIWFGLMKNTNRSLALLSVMVILGACSSDNGYKNPQVVAEPDKVSIMLAQAADRASNALESLAAIEQTRTPGAEDAPSTNIPAELKRGMTVNWIGPVEGILKTVTNRASYKFTVLGESPANDVVVSLDMENKPIFDVLRSIGLQLGTRADVRVDSKNQTVELRYRSLLSQLDPL